MKATFIRTEGEYLEAVIKASGSEFVVVDEFGGEDMTPGEEFEVELSPLVVDPGEWDEIFAGNPGGEKGLRRVAGWRYLALGEVVSVDPVVVDCGVLSIAEPFFSHDERCVGEFVGFPIARLDASKKT